MAIQDDATKQLGALPFGNIIGGPLVAAIEAQAQAARSSVEFIKSVAFKPDSNGNPTNDVQMINFTYMQKGVGTNPTNPTNPTNKDVTFNKATLEVPLLAIVPIPYIRIDDMTIQFKANISAESSSKDTTTDGSGTDVKGNVTGHYGWGPARVEASFSAGYSAKKDSTSVRDSKYSVEYTMDIYIHAVNDDMPKGMATVLQLLNQSIEGKTIDAKNSPNETGTK